VGLLISENLVQALAVLHLCLDLGRVFGRLLCKFGFFLLSFEFAIDTPVLSTLNVPLLGRVGRTLIFVQVHTLPVSVVPAELLAGLLVFSEIGHFLSECSDLVEAFGAAKFFLEIVLALHTRMQKLEHMGTHTAIVPLTIVFLEIFEVVSNHLIHVNNLVAIEQRWILKNGLA